MKKDKKIIAFDVGDQWIGVAHALDSLPFVFPYQTWQAYQFVDKFSAYLHQYNVEIAVVGLPLTLKGNESQQTEKVKAWVTQMEKIFFPIKFFFEDERLSSKFATNIAVQNNNKKKYSNHELAAALILENFLNKNKKN